MNRRICLALIAPVLLAAHPAPALEGPVTPQVLFEDLYADVELQRIFPDSKEFADATPKAPPTWFGGYPTVTIPTIRSF